MRQIVSLVKDNQVHYALVDDDSGEMIPFADLLLPDPDRFGLHDAALVGTNLINALGLNGSAKRKATIPRVGDVRIGGEEEQLALIAPEPLAETQRQRHARLAREKYHREKAKGKTKGGADRFITLNEVVAIINEYPEGITTAQIAERVWRADGGQGETPAWYRQSVGNRQVLAEINAKDGKMPLPYRIEHRAKIGKDGLPTKLRTKYLLPLVPAPGQGGV